MMIFLGFTVTRVYRDWKIKEEMYFLNKELKKAKEKQSNPDSVDSESSKNPEDEA